MKTILLAVTTFFFVEARAQTIDNSKDTVFINKVPLRNVLVDRSTGRIIKMWPIHKKKVVSGYIVNRGNGFWLVNGKILEYNEDSKGGISFIK